jgi:putative tryptophan/tyrosine transport system substrate-binding protein
MPSGPGEADYVQMARGEGGKKSPVARASHQGIAAHLSIERAYMRGPGFCCVCGQPVYRFGWHVDLWDTGANKNAVWHCACPGGNVTGVTTVSAELEAKRLGLLRELVPSATSVAVLVNPTRPGVDTQLAQIQQAARVLGLPLHILKASSERDLDEVFATLVQLRAGALTVTADSLFAERRDQIVALARRNSVPTMSQFREFVASGGLISYGPSFGESYRQAGILAGRILRGEKPAGLPVIQPTKFELVINIKTAKALGIEVPISMQMLADEVID